jgi:hypothetical protein
MQLIALPLGQHLAPQRLAFNYADKSCYVPVAYALAV